MSKKKRFNIEVQVIGNAEKSLRQMKKKMEREGVTRDIKRLAYHETPTQKRRKRLLRAIKNNVMKNYEYIQLKSLSKSKT